MSRIKAKQRSQRRQAPIIARAAPGRGMGPIGDDAEGGGGRWLWEGVVTSKPKCLENGWFVEVSLFGDEVIEETARVGSIYAGNGFGFYFPLSVGEEVVVYAPGGGFEGLIVMPRVWNGDCAPPADLQQGTEDDDTPALEDLVLLHVQDGVNLRLRTGGAGKITLQAAEGGVEITSEGGDVTVDTDKDVNISCNNANITAVTKVTVDAPLIDLGGECTAQDGVVTGLAIDSFTGSLQYALGNASTRVRAKKV